MKLDAIKNKEVKLNALSFHRRETGFDDEFMELVKLADKINTLNNAELSIHAGVTPENRAALTAAKMKFQYLQKELTKLLSTVGSLGTDPKKFSKNLLDISSKKSEFSAKHQALNDKLPDDLKLPLICPYFTGFLEE